MRAITTAARAVLGGYLAAHGAQKLFGSFGGAGLDGTAEMFGRLGLTPGREMAALAGVSELTGGILTATGVADPFGPIAVASTMAVAATVHRKAGPFATKGGYELPLTNLAFAVVLATARPGHRAGPSLPAPVTALVFVGAAALAGVAVSKLLSPAPPTADEPA
jgi:putative oxidoreductase